MWEAAISGERWVQEFTNVIVDGADNKAGQLDRNQRHADANCQIAQWFAHVPVASGPVENVTRFSFEDRRVASQFRKI